MTAMQIIILATALTFGYVLVRFIHVMAFVDRGTRRFAEGSLVFTMAAPALVFLRPVAQAMPERDLEVLVLGSALWVTLALAFWAFAARRMATDGPRLQHP